MPEPLVIWRFTDGKPGHMQQTLGLTQALSRLTPCEVIDFDVVANPVTVIDFIMGRFSPGLACKRPDFILGAGHATHFALLAARRAVGGRIVVLMKPSLPLFFFDHVIAPEHDGVPESPRILKTRGVLNPMMAGDKKPDSLLFLIGGPSKHVSWDSAAVLAQLDAVIATLPSSICWRITDSRRTPEALREELQRRYGERFKSVDQCQPGWLAEQLAITETVWVSEDSVSMVYEALTAGCCVGLLSLPSGNAGNRVMRGMRKLAENGIVIRFDDWSVAARALPSPPDFNEALRAARWLLEQR